ncbi:MAG: response regulator transcription factor [Bdellovibrionales bacterium]|nr:response regulator transcription factor [Bdellovibrionales bacterium]
MHNVLLVEDSREIFEQVKAALGSSVKVLWVETVKDARDMVGKNNISLVLLDVELPDGSGVDLCSEFQANYPQLPVFLLTAHKQLPEKVMGFTAGAEDYITKPFESMELRARVEAKLRKLEVVKQSKLNMEWKELEVLLTRQEVFVHGDKGKEKADLTALEFKILTYFCHHLGEVIPRDQMLNEIWGENIHIYPRSVDTHVSKLRRKLGSAVDVIKSIHGVGYKFDPTPL